MTAERNIVLKESVIQTKCSLLSKIINFSSFCDMNFFRLFCDINFVFLFCSRHELKNGDKFRGNTTFLFEQYNHLKQMNDLYSLFLDSDDVIYWVVFQESDLNSTATFLRTVQTGDIYEFLQ